MSKIDVDTLWTVISQQQNEPEKQFLLCMIQKALEKHSNTFIFLHVFKQTWRWNYHSMNVSGYWNVIEKWRMLLKFNDVGTSPPTRVTMARIRDKFEVDETVQDVFKGLITSLIELQSVSNWCIHCLKLYFSAMKWDRNRLQFLLCTIQFVILAIENPFNCLREL